MRLIPRLNTSLCLIRIPDLALPRYIATRVDAGPGTFQGAPTDPWVAMASAVLPRFPSPLREAEY